MTLTQSRTGTTEVRHQPPPQLPGTPERPGHRRAGLIVGGAVLVAALATALVVFATTRHESTADPAPETAAAAPAPPAVVPATAIDPHHLHCMRSGTMVADRLQERAPRCRQFSAHTTACLAVVASSPDAKEAWTSACQELAWARLR